MTRVALELPSRVRDYEDALDGALEALREYWDASGSDVALVEELLSALRTQAA